MNRCLCCGKALSTPTSLGWHNACIKEFFGTSQFPDIDITDDTLNQLTIDSTNKGYTVTGVQKKLSLHLSAEDNPRLTLVNYPTGYILKPQTEEYKALPEMEYLIMQMAKASSIKTVPFALLRLPSSENEFAYITKRIDRADGKILAMEDFCQLGGRLTEDKYRGSYERCGKIITEFSSTKGMDMAEFFIRIVFSFIIGNSDMHLKNFSLIETYEGSGKYSLSDAYDLLSTNVIIPEDKEQLALTINGKKQNIRRKDFFALAENIGLNKKSAEKMIAKILKLKESYIRMCDESYLPEDMKTALAELIQNRCSVFEC
ncbi:MAG: HipA domain-containing protein [Clostridia bacterium]|nr:HipA domain-containing protein [Clostridia bacterium]